MRYFILGFLTGALILLASAKLPEPAATTNAGSCGCCGSGVCECVDCQCGK